MYLYFMVFSETVEGIKTKLSGASSFVLLVTLKNIRNIKISKYVEVRQHRIG